ncbi:MAG: hypothetical protein EOS55_05770 [Mesorhizobium sp.]|nr:MAG: hypothetical protein EOS55_05770 [Mesorhizobium sp.]
MSPKSVQRFWGNDMHEKEKCMSPKSVQRFWGNDMHHSLDGFGYFRLANRFWPVDPPHSYLI